MDLYSDLGPGEFGCSGEPLRLRGPLRVMSHRPVSGGFCTPGPQPFVVAEYPDGLSIEVCREVDGSLEADIYRAASPRRKRVGLNGWGPLLAPNGWVRLISAPSEPVWWGWSLGDYECFPREDQAEVIRTAYGLGQDGRDRAYALHKWSGEPGFYATRYKASPGEPWIDPIALLAEKIAYAFEEGTDLIRVTRDELETDAHAQRANLADLLSEALQGIEGPLWIDGSGLPMPEHKASSWLAKVFEPIHDRAVIVSVPEWRHPGIAKRLWEYSRRK